MSHCSNCGHLSHCGEKCMQTYKDGDKIKTVRFGDANMSIKRDDPVRRKAFFDRMKPILAKVKGQKNLSPVYWALRSWKLGTKI